MIVRCLSQQCHTMYHLVRMVSLPPSSTSTPPPCPPSPASPACPALAAWPPLVTTPSHHSPLVQTPPLQHTPPRMTRPCSQQCNPHHQHHRVIWSIRWRQTLLLYLVVETLYLIKSLTSGPALPTTSSIAGWGRSTMLR